MKRLLSAMVIRTALLFLAVLLLSASGRAQSFVQNAEGGWVNQTSGTITLSQYLTTAGHTIVAQCSYTPVYGHCTTPPTDTEGNTFILISTRESASGAVGQKIYHALNIHGGSNDAITCYSELVTGVFCGAIEIIGNAIDQGSDATEAEGNSTAPASPAITTASAAVEIVLGFGAMNTGSSSNFIAYGTGWNGINEGTTQEQYRVTSAVGSYTSTGTIDVADNWVMGIFSYYLIGGGGGGGGAVPTNSVLPVISGSTTQGSLLSTTNGTWSGDAPISYTYQWGRCNSSGSSCVNISGATSNSYTLTATDVGSTIRSNVKATNNAGNTTATSTQTAVITTSAGIAITPSAPVVNQGGTINFTENNSDAGTWSCSGTDSSGNATTCAGSIVAGTGVYTAPSTVTNQQTAGGMQLLPNNHIFNTRIDSAQLRSDSTTLINGAGGTPLTMFPGFPLNYADGSTPIENQVFVYTNNNDGPFQIPAYPGLRIENGYFNARQYNPFSNDHHLLVMDTTNGTMQEMYQYYPAGTCSERPGCTSTSGQRYSNSSYILPLTGSGNGTTDAAGLDLWPLTLRLQELDHAVAAGGTVNHALRWTLQNGLLHNAFLWPAVQSTNNGSGANFYGERVRLKSTFNISGLCGADTICTTIMTTLKQYGMFMADGGPGWQAVVENTRWPKVYADAFRTIWGASIAPSNFEVVDDDLLKLSDSSGESKYNREIVTFTRTSDSATASVDVVLRGVAVNLPSDLYRIQAGTPAQQLAAFVNIGSVTWTMSPTVGTLTSGGLYTPPATSSSIQGTTVTATSSVNSAVYARMSLAVYPQGTIRLVPGQGSDYVDSGGHTWFKGELAGGDGAESFLGEPQFGQDNGGSWPSTTDITLYKINVYATGDLRFDVYVPNNTYTVTAKISNNSGGGGDNGNFLVETQGVASGVVDVFSLVGNNQPYDVVQQATVTNNKLSLVLRNANATGGGSGPFIAAVQIDPSGGSPTAPANTVLPAVTGTTTNGSTLTTSTGTWTGTTPINFTYQWRKCDAAGNNCANIGAATNSTYLVLAGDVGSTIRCVVTGTNSAGNASATSAQTAVITLTGNPVNTSLPAVAGTMVQTLVVTASSGNWTGNAPITFTYQWRRCDVNGNNCANISAATASSYTLVLADVGSTIRVIVTGTNSLGSAVATSPASAVVLTASPVNTVLPVISGNTTQNSVLSTTSGTWTGAPPINFTYQWRRCNSSGASCADIGSATSSTYTLVAGDVNSTIRVVVTGVNSSATVPATSVQTQVISAAPVAPANTALPVISGTPQQGFLLATTDGTWTGTPVITFTYQWRRCDNAGANCSDIPSATTNTYTLTSSDVTTTIRVVVTGINGAGNASATSAQTALITGQGPPPDTTTTLNGSLKYPNGQPLTGSLTLSVSKTGIKNICSTQATIATTPATFSITNGAVQIKVVPNDCFGTFVPYTAQLRTSGSVAAVQFYLWITQAGGGEISPVGGNQYLFPFGFSPLANGNDTAYFIPQVLSGFTTTSIAVSLNAGPYSRNLTLNWPTPFADATYTAVCTALDQTRPLVPTAHITSMVSKTRTSVTVAITNDTGGTARTATVTCRGRAAQ